MSFSSKDVYHLPYLTTVPNNTPRTELQTAHVEFCDLSRPSGTDNDNGKDCHNAFRAKQPILPRIQKRIMPNTPEQEIVSKSYPTLNFSKCKVQTKFTEGLSSLSRSDEPLYSIQRKDVLAANLPNTIKLSQERNKSYFTINCNIYSEQKMKSHLKPKKLAERGRIKCNVTTQPQRLPILRFAPDVLEDSPIQKRRTSDQNERPVTPYYPESKRPKQHAIVPNVVCVGESLKEEIEDTLVLNSRQKQQYPIVDSRHRQRVPPPKETGLSKAQIEIPDSILRDSSFLKSNKRYHGNSLEQNKYPTNQIKQICHEEGSSKVFKLFVKMPQINGFGTFMAPPTTPSEGYYLPQNSPTISIAAQSPQNCDNHNNIVDNDLIRIDSVNSNPLCIDTYSNVHNQKEVDILNTDLCCREVTTQIYSDQ
ncbi:hypothetical protein SNE40_005699 [Patella caerulea]|uniref:Uncharacterized protein n=1 Tax=Patella caerulea TaxID=87958 RepID=A0AAN8JXI1_PATCE